MGSRKYCLRVSFLISGVDLLGYVVWWLCLLYFESNTQNYQSTISKNYVDSVYHLKRLIYSMPQLLYLKTYGIDGNLCYEIILKH